jgi:hypothetical protein
MTQSKSNDTQNKQSDHHSEDELAKERAGVNVDKSSHNAKATVKAGTNHGAGGGAKQKEGK